MDLLAEYGAQDRWRDWDAMLKRLPIARDQTVLDLGCGPGSVSARLAARATNVVGVDHNAEFISAARQRCPNNCTFIEADLRALDPRVIPRAHGLWSSFACRICGYAGRANGAPVGWPGSCGESCNWTSSGQIACHRACQFPEMCRLGDQRKDFPLTRRLPRQVTRRIPRCLQAFPVDCPRAKLDLFARLSARTCNESPHYGKCLLIKAEAIPLKLLQESGPTSLRISGN